MHHANCCEDDQFIDDARNQLPPTEDIDRLGEFYKMFAEPTRLKIIGALLQGELCVGSITNILDMSQSSVSHQLRLLKRLNLIKSRKEGKWVYYSISDDHVRTIYEMGLSHIQE